MVKKNTNVPSPSIALELRKDTEALKLLEDLEELVDVPPERGGVYFSDWERDFIRNVREYHDGVLGFSSAQRDKIKEIWYAIDLRRAPDEKPANLFSKLSPERQAEQRARAAAVKLPWEK